MHIGNSVRESTFVETQSTYEWLCWKTKWNCSWKCLLGQPL